MALKKHILAFLRSSINSTFHYHNPKWYKSIYKAQTCGNHSLNDVKLLLFLLPQLNTKFPQSVLMIPFIKINILSICFCAVYFQYLSRNCSSLILFSFVFSIILTIAYFKLLCKIIYNHQVLISLVFFIYLCIFHQPTKICSKSCN